jgi:hypothetical protein
MANRLRAMLAPGDESSASNIAVSPRSVRCKFPGFRHLFDKNPNPEILGSISVQARNSKWNGMFRWSESIRDSGFDIRIYDKLLFFDKRFLAKKDADNPVEKNQNVI